MRYYRTGTAMLIFIICVATYIIYDRSSQESADKAHNSGSFQSVYYYSDYSKQFHKIFAKFVSKQPTVVIDIFPADEDASTDIDITVHTPEVELSSEVADFSNEKNVFDYSQYIIKPAPEDYSDDDTDSTMLQADSSDEVSNIKDVKDHFFASVRVDKINKALAKSIKSPFVAKKNINKNINVMISEDIKRCISPVIALSKYSDDVHMKMVTVQNQLFAIDRELNVSEFSTLSCNWSSVKLTYPDKPLARTESSISVVDNKIYVFGGWSYGSQYFNDIWFYDISNKIWIKETASKKLPKRAYHSATVVGDRIYYFGGYNGTFLNDVWVFNTKRSRWDNIKTDVKPPATGYHKATLVEDNIYITDGYGKLSVVNDIWVFDIKESDWRSIEAPSGSDKLALINEDVLNRFSNRQIDVASATLVDRYGRGYTNNSSMRINSPKIVFESGDIEISSDYEYIQVGDLVYLTDRNTKYTLFDSTTEKKVIPIDYNVDIFYVRPDTSIRHR